MHTGRYFERCNLIILLVGFAGRMVLAAPQLQIPFELNGHLIVVRGSIDNLEDLKLVIDTGSTYTVIQTRLARRLGLEGEEGEAIAFGRTVTVERAVVGNLRIGPLNLEDVPVRVARLPSFCSVAIDGLVGLDVLRHSNWILDFETCLLSVGRTKLPKDSQAFYPALPYLQARLSVGGNKIGLMLDTGVDQFLLFEQKARGRVPMNLTRDARNIRHVGGRARLKEVFLKNVSMGQTRWKTLGCYLTPTSSKGYEGAVGILGPLSLGMKRLYLDFDHSRVGWEF